MQRIDKILTLAFLRMYLEHVKMFTGNTNSYASCSECPLRACSPPDKVQNVLVVFISSILWHTKYACNTCFSLHESRLKLS